MRLTTNKLLFFIIAVVVYIILTLNFFQNYVQTNRERKLIKPPKKLLILVSQPRSGSSYLGRVFSKSLQSIYFYEPLYQLYNYLHGDTNFSSVGLNFDKYDRSAQAYLQNVFKCNFKEKKNWFPIFKSKLKELSSFFRDYECDQTKEKKQPPGSRVKNGYTFNRCMPYFNPFALQQDCHKLNLMVKLLETRLPRTDLLNLQKLIDENTSYKIIYLVRDPRASFLSLLRLGWITETLDKNFKAYIKLRCNEMMTNIEAVTKNQDYVILRYEDLMTKSRQVLQPLKTNIDQEVIQKIISTLENNICYVPVFNENYFVINTRANNVQPKTEQPLQKDTMDNMSDEENDPLSDEIIVSLQEKQKRNYECFSINKWRYKAEKDFVGAVEESCVKVMNVMGYHVVGNNFHQIKNTKYSMVGKLNLY